MRKLYTYRIIILAFTTFNIDLVFGQENDSFSFTSLVETYYCYDFEKPTNHEKPFFFFNHKRHNEVNINLAYAKASYFSKQIRGNLGLMVGNYAQYNLASEPDLYRNILEANIGVKLTSKNNIWMDAGVMPSHIGFESAISLDCWNLSRSLLAENSPFYETGVKISGTSMNQKLYIAAMYLNGWQKIVRLPGHNKPCGGMQITYNNQKGFVFNYSSFAGADLPDSLQSFRLYNNFYTTIERSSNLGFTLGFDYGLERGMGKKWRPWYSPVIIARKKYKNGNALAGRCEFYYDPSQIVIPVQTKDGFEVFGLSANYDIKLGKEAFWRNELKWFYSKDAIFKNDTQKNNFTLLTSLTVRISK